MPNVNTQGYSRQSVVFQNGGRPVHRRWVYRQRRRYCHYPAQLQCISVGASPAGRIHPIGGHHRADKLKQLKGCFLWALAVWVPPSTACFQCLFRRCQCAHRPHRTHGGVDAHGRNGQPHARSLATTGRPANGDHQRTKRKRSAKSTVRPKHLPASTTKGNAGSQVSQPPNDLLDRRDQPVRDPNQYVQTTSIPATDGTVGIFIGAVKAGFGNPTAPVSLVPNFSGPRPYRLRSPDWHYHRRSMKMPSAVAGSRTAALSEHRFGGGTQFAWLTNDRH